MSDIPVWQVDMGEEKVALLEVSVEEFAPFGETLKVPLCHNACDHMLSWRGQWIPIIGDVNAASQFLIMRVRKLPNLSVIGIAIPKLPKKNAVADTDFQAFDARQCGIWKKVAVSGYTTKDQNVAIIDPDRLATTGFLDALSEQLH